MRSASRTISRTYHYTTSTKALIKIQGIIYDKTNDRMGGDKTNNGSEEENIFIKFDDYTDMSKQKKGRRIFGKQWMRTERILLTNEVNKSRGIMLCVQPVNQKNSRKSQKKMFVGFRVQMKKLGE